MQRDDYKAMADGHLKALFEALSRCDESDEVAIEEAITRSIYESCQAQGIPMAEPTPTFEGAPL